MCFPECGSTDAAYLVRSRKGYCRTDCVDVVRCRRAVGFAQCLGTRTGGTHFQILRGHQLHKTPRRHGYTSLPCHSARGVSKFLFQMWEHAVKACSEVILDGLSNVKRCTMPGRSMMSLDLSYVESNFKFMAPVDVLVSLRIVDAYIKVFCLFFEFWKGGCA